MIEGLRVQGVAAGGGSIDMEACFSQLTLDVIGKAVFNYDFDALNASSPLIQVRSHATCWIPSSCRLSSSPGEQPGLAWHGERSEHGAAT